MQCLMCFLILVIAKIPSAEGCKVRSWTPWSQCPISCGHGQQRRFRVNVQCKTIEETKPCLANPCHAPENAPCPTAWGQWSDCSVSCGNGSQLRFRHNHGHPPGTCFIIPHYRECVQELCPTASPRICKIVEDLTTAAALPTQLYIPEGLQFYQCAQLSYTIISPVSYGVLLKVSFDDNRHDSNSTIEIIDETSGTSAASQTVLYKGILTADQYHTKSNKMLVLVKIQNAPQFAGVTLLYQSYMVNDNAGQSVPGCSHQCYEHSTTQPSGTTGIMSLQPERHRQCLIKVWILKPILTKLLPTLNRMPENSLRVTFPQLTLPATDKIEILDGHNKDSPLIYKGRTLPIQLFTSGQSVRLTLQICNISLYHHLQISYQSVTKRKASVEVLEPPTDRLQLPTQAVRDSYKLTEASVQLDSSLNSSSTAIIATVAEKIHTATTATGSPTLPSSFPHPVNCSYEHIPKYLQPQPLPEKNFYNVNSNVTVTCSQPKTNMKGQNKFSCSPEGTWLPSEWPKCVAKKPKKNCIDPPSVENSYFISKPYRVGQTVTYVCKTRYKLNGNDTLKCVDNGNKLGEWNMAPPKCELTRALCKQTEWSEWSICSSQCGPGTQHRSRIRILGNNIENCEARQETRKCPVVEPCPTPQIFWPCGGRIRKSKGRFSSPGYPYGYLSNQECIWTIQVPLGYRIHLHFRVLDTEKVFDIVEVRDGAYKNSYLLGEFSGQSNKTKMKSTDNQLYIRFKTDGTNERKGFVAKFSSSVVKKNVKNCGTNLVGSLEMQMLSPIYSSSNAIDCEWIILTSRQYCCSQSALLRLNITFFDSQEKRTVLEIRDGATKQAPLIEFFSGETPYDKQPLDLYSCQAYIHYWSLKQNKLHQKASRDFSLTYQVFN